MAFVSFKAKRTAKGKVDCWTFERMCGQVEVVIKGAHKRGKDTAMENRTTLLAA